MSLVGKKIQEFNVRAFHDNEFKTITNEDFIGKWNILMFYPADFSFVCPTELEDLQENYAKLKELGVEVYSASTDSEFAHCAWHLDNLKISVIEYPMLADPSWKLSRAFDVLDEEQGMAQRGTFIIDPEGVIQAEEITADGIGRNASHLLNKVKAAQFIRKYPDQVCPAKWVEEDEAIERSLDKVNKI
ncbi:MAG: peroxiredoxin [Streptococcaceae bacterium]|jgi:peroxiredoxin (alkyl hydroperoxide reductase subunit C)|nr:peroxiredoxin [Streptococcaceae bacterium]